MQLSKNPNPVLGIMSGTSLDGVDLALCLFQEENAKIRYSFLQTETIPLPAEWLDFLSDPFSKTAEELAKAHVDFGIFLGKSAKNFLKKHQTKAALIASHGHTVFHQPNASYTFQLGHGAAIAHTAGVDTVCDFRTGDVVLGGQGAPLVPLGDELLFSEYDACLNLGGFSNISCRLRGKGRIGFDISPVNVVLNRLANRLGKPFDEDGTHAEGGHLLPELLEKLNELAFYQQEAPKSLAIEWVQAHVLPLLEEKYDTTDLLRTFTEHIAIQIARSTAEYELTNLLSTGGGTKNRFLMERIKALHQGNLHIPDAKTLDYKEALIFALLGYLRLQEKTNILSSVTGASLNSCSGAVYKAFPQLGY